MLRDLAILSIVVFALAVTFRRPYAGALLWAWLSILNPHRYSYGVTYSMPLAMIAALVTFISMMMHRDQIRSVPSLPVV